nr:ATP-binding protein [Tatlockia sp.]
IAHRYEYGSLLITANQPFGDWDTLFPDKIMAVAAIDRIVHHAKIIKVEGESYRANAAIQRNNKL